MEAVRAFNNELSSIYEVKPPISRAKMATVTKTAIKAIKYYKHVVQSIEKFIQKCKPEYKVPGLYVIDSVVRQSRHQFGSNKDMFAPRFTKNIINTFQNLFKCPGEERSKIVRVLNLWQKNEVFPSEIVQPLLDLAADPTKPSNIAAAQASVDGWLAANGKPAGTQPAPAQPASQPSGQEEQMGQSTAESMLATQNDMLNTVTQLLQHTNSSNSSLSAQQQQLQHLQLLQQQLVQQTHLMQQPTGAGPIIDPNLLAQIQTLTNQLLSKTDSKPEETGFNKKLLDFDYGESDEEDDKKHPPTGNGANLSGNVQNILSDPSLMQQIHQVSQSIQKNEEMKSEMDEERRRVLEQQQAEFDHQIALSMPPHHQQSNHHQQQHQQPPPQHPPHHPPPHQPMPFDQPPPMPDNVYREEGEYEEGPNDDDFRDHHQLKDRDEREGRRDRRRRSRSRSPKRRRKTRSRSRERRRRSRSRSKSRHKRSRSKDREREEREKQKEKERERKRKSLPPLKDQHAAICTTTIWIGHLNKFTQEEELKQEIERYGPVLTISMVPPRGCAYIVMKERKDAARAIDRLKGFKLNGSSLKTAWAQSSGIRDSDYKDGWDVDIGTLYIPWDRLPMDLSSLLEGAIVDSESLPDRMKEVPVEKLAEQASGELAEISSQPSNLPDQAPQQQTPIQTQPPMMGMMPPGMPPQMQGMMPGMMMPMQQRPLVPGMPPHSMGMAPGQPMVPGPPRPQQPGPAVAMSIASSTASTIAQTIQNMLPTSAGLVQGSPGAPRQMGFPPRFGFNPNMPPPGFRMPPPGFPGHMRPFRMPTMPPSEDKLVEMQNKEGPPREMIWPPDSNEKDEDDMDEEEAEGEKDKDSDKSDRNEPPSGFMPVKDQPPFNMMGPVPPGGFPPGGPPGGPPGQPWTMAPMRIRGPMRFPMGMPPDIFNGPRGPMMGPGGPMGPPPFMGMGPGGFPPRFPPGMGPGPRPVSLLDLDIKPPPRFSGERKEDSEGEENQEEDQEEPGNESVGENAETVDEPQEGGQAQDEDDDDPRNSYPFNNWQSVSRNQRNKDNRNDEREENDGRSRGWGEENNRNRRDFDRRDRDRGDRNRDRDWGRDRGDRDREGRGDRERGDRGERGERDWRRDRDRGGRDRGDDGERGERGDRERGDRGERDRGRERGERRQRKSRWGDPVENVGEDSEPQPPVLDREEGFPDMPNEESVNNVSEPDIANEDNSEAMPGIVNNDSEYDPFKGDTNDNVTEGEMDAEIVEDSLKQCDEDHQSDTLLNGENASELETPFENGPPSLQDQEFPPADEDTAPTTNGPESVEDTPSIVPNKLDVIHQVTDSGDAEPPQETTDQTASEMVDLEEGELDS